MAQVIFMNNAQTPKEAGLARAVFSFIEKLTTDDTLPGLAIKPLNNMKDRRVRTGRVNRNFRAVLVELEGVDQPTYVYLGTWKHDEAIAFAQQVEITINPVTGVPELSQWAPQGDSAASGGQQSRHDSSSWHHPPQVERIPASGSQPRYPVLETWGHTVESLENNGLKREEAQAAMALETEDELINYATALKPKWKGLFLVEIGTGKSPEEAFAELGVEPAGAHVDLQNPTDDDLRHALELPASLLDFAIINPDEVGMAELAAVLEEADTSQWRVFLHPQQRAYANRDRNGAFRLSGGAGTGKTVVLVHRARTLHRKNADARIVLTTFGRTLADGLADQVATLDASIPQVGLGGKGVTVSGVDALVRKVLTQAGEDVALPGPLGHSPLTQVLGPGRATNVLGVTDEDALWQEAASSVDLPERITVNFLREEYAMVILPARITEERQYLRIPRPGRGTRLSRGDRRKVWEVVRTYRAHASADGTTDWGEKAMIAASYLDARVARGYSRPADHVLVDETQDLRPTHLHFVRALVSEGMNDLFLADDAHQRIYAPKVTLSHYGINIRGRSRRLTLNYRTTAQNFAYALNVLDGVEYTGMDGEEVTIEGYRSARSGVPPIMHPCHTQEEEYEAIANQILEWPSHTGHTVGVLCGTTREAEAWVRALGGRGVKAKFVGRDAPAELPDVSVLTRHRAKGMEFTRVALVGMGEGAKFPGADSADADDAELRERSLVYVGATRARDALAVSWVGRAHPVLEA